MSLTSQLKDKSSAMSRFYVENLKSPLAPLVNYKNSLLSQKRPLVAAGSDPRTVGKAFGYALRWWINPYHMQTTVAAVGARNTSNGKMFAAMLEMGNAKPDAIPMLSVLMTAFDDAARGDSAGAESLFDDYLRRYKHYLALPDPGVLMLEGESASDRLIRQNVFDVATLFYEIPIALGDRAEWNMKRVVFNPTFNLSRIVGGADAWMISDGVIWDCRTSAKSKPFDEFNLLQQLGYALLDTHDEFKIKSISWYYSRQRVTISIELSRLVRDLSDLRNKLDTWLDAERDDDDDDDDRSDEYGFFDDYEDGGYGGYVR